MWRIRCTGSGSRLGVLQIYAPLLEADARAKVNGSLRAVGRLLSPARDAEVICDQVAERIAALPGGPDGPTAMLVPRRIARQLRKVQADAYDAAHCRIVQKMRTAWYLRQLDLLDAFADEVPLNAGLTAGQRGDAVAALAPLAAAQIDHITELSAQALAEESPEGKNNRLHDVRKEAKRLRYAVKAVGEATGMDLGAELDTAMTRAKKLQSSLGTHRDSVMFQEHVLCTSRQAKKLR